LVDNYRHALAHELPPIVPRGHTLEGGTGG
jgi:hypothetical protein